MTETKISVCICTRNPRRGTLERVLQALRNQCMRLTDWELLIIDNGSAVPLVDTLDLSWHPKGRVVREETAGLTRARLAAIREASGALMVFVDDDNLLAHDYLVEVLEISRKWPTLGCWGGSLIPEFEENPKSWSLPLLYRLAIHTVERPAWSNLYDNVETMPAGAGMVIRLEVARVYASRVQHCEHAMSLDRVGASLGGYGDIDMACCAIDCGYGTGRFPSLSLLHVIPVERLTARYFIRHAEADACSRAVFTALRRLPVAEPPSRLRRAWLIVRSLLRMEPPVCRLLMLAEWRGLALGVQRRQELTAWENAR